MKAGKSRIANKHSWLISLSVLALSTSTQKVADIYILHTTSRYLSTYINKELFSIANISLLIYEIVRISYMYGTYATFSRDADKAKTYYVWRL